MYGTSEKSSRLGKIPVLRMGNINREGGLDWKDLVYSNNEEDIEKFNLLHNDLLFNRTNSSEWVGKTAIYKGERPAIYAGYIIRLRTIFVNADYINFVMNSQYHRNWCNDVKTDAVNQSNINAQKLSVFRVPLPPIEEQNRIVKEIKRWLSLIKVIKSGKENLQESIKQTKSKVLDLAIHGKLVPQDPNEEPAIELLKRINPKAEIITDNGHYQKLPEGWTICRLKDISKIVTGSTPSKSNSGYYGGIFPFFKPADLDAGRHVYKAAEYLSEDGKKASKVVPKGTTAICCIGTIGKVGYLMYEGTTNQQINCAIPSKVVDSVFLFYLCASPQFNDNLNSESSAVTISIVNKSKIEAISVPLPPLAEQKRIVSKIEEIFAQLEAIETAL